MENPRRPVRSHRLFTKARSERGLSGSDPDVAGSGMACGLQELAQARRALRLGSGVDERERPRRLLSRFVAPGERGIALGELLVEVRVWLTGPLGPRDRLLEEGNRLGRAAE